MADALSPTLQQSPPQPVAKVSDTLGSAEYAGFGARFLAVVIDVALTLGVNFLVIAIPIFVLSFTSVIFSGGSELLSVTTSWLLILLQGIGLLLSFGYYVYFTARGQTLGKKALKIKVVRIEDSQVPGYTKAFLREVVGKLVSAMVFGLGYLWMLWDGKKQTWHDKIAGTIVVKA